MQKDRGWKRTGQKSAKSLRKGHNQRSLEARLYSIRFLHSRKSDLRAPRLAQAGCGLPKPDTPLSPAQGTVPSTRCRCGPRDSGRDRTPRGPGQRLSLSSVSSSPLPSLLLKSLCSASKSLRPQFSVWWPLSHASWVPGIQPQSRTAARMSPPWKPLVRGAP